MADLTDPPATLAEPSVSYKATRNPHPLDKYFKGYPKMAARMGLIPQTAMFRRFGTLNARNLLYFQNELAEIEENLQEQALEDAKSDVGKKKLYSQYFYWLNDATEERDGDVKQRVLVMRLRETLKEYSNYLNPHCLIRCCWSNDTDYALIQQHKILKMSAPDAYDVKNMQHLMCSDLMDANKVLLGNDANTYGDPWEKDSESRALVFLREREGPDAFSRLASSISVPVVQKFDLPSWKKLDLPYGGMTVRDATALNLTFWITSIIASVILCYPSSCWPSLKGSM